MFFPLFLSHPLPPDMVVLVADERVWGSQCCASMWTAEEAQQILSIARGVRPGLKTHIIPHGLQVERGPDAIVDHLVAELPRLIAQP